MNLEKAEPIAKLHRVSKQFKTLQVLQHIELQIFRGEVLAILGPNGAGKTTLINLLLGRYSLSCGDIQIFGLKPGDIALKRLCGAMLQVPNLPETLRVREHIELFQSYYASPLDYHQVIELAGLESIQTQLSKTLSGGQKQRLLFALAICGNPQLLFLDEPSVGMDVNARQKLWQAIKTLRDQGTSIVLTTHYLEEADQLADRIVMLNHGRIIQQGTPQAIKAQVQCQKIRFTSTLPAAVFEAIDSVVRIYLDNGRVEMETRNSIASLRHLFNLTDDIQDLSVSSTALEEAFLQLNRQSDEYRDAYSERKQNAAVNHTAG